MFYFNQFLHNLSNRFFKNLIFIRFKGIESIMDCVNRVLHGHWLHEISIFKTVHHHFWPGIIPPQ